MRLRSLGVQTDICLNLYKPLYIQYTCVLLAAILVLRVSISIITSPTTFRFVNQVVNNTYNSM